MHFCGKQQVNVTDPSVSDILEYLNSLHNENLGYSSVNTAKSMLSSLLSLKDTGKDPLICHFMKGIFNLKPALPRHVNMWNVQKVIEYLDSLISSELNLKLLSVKLATLLALATGQQCQTLSNSKLVPTELQSNINLQVSLLELYNFIIKSVSF